MPTYNQTTYWGSIAKKCWSIIADPDASQRDFSYADGVLHALSAQGFSIQKYREPFDDLVRPVQEKGPHK